MLYVIYLDTQLIDEFDSTEKEAIEKYNELKQEYIGEEIYDLIKLFGVNLIKEEKL